MIDILLLGLFISIVLVGSTVFIGQEELRAQRGREEAVYSQAQLVAGMNYRLSGGDWKNLSASEMINYRFCNGTTVTVGPTNCSSNDAFYIDMQKMLNRTGRTGYNYIFYAEAAYNNTTSGTMVSLGSYTVCNLQPTACAKHIPAIATTDMSILCPQGTWIGIHYLNGLWPDWMVLPLACED